MQISQRFFSLTGVLLIFGSLFVAVGQVLKPMEPASREGVADFISQSLISDSFLLIGMPFVLLGLVGLFVRQADQLKWLGWIGYPLMGLGLLYVDVIQPVIRLVAYPFVLENANTEEEIFNAVTTIYDQDPFSYFFPLLLLSLIGPVWSAIAFLKTKVFPVWLSVMLLLLLPIFIISGMFNIDNFPVYLYVVIGIFGVKLAFDSKRSIASSLNETTATK